MGKTPGILAAAERASWTATRLANEFQGVCYQRLPSAATQEVEGLNGPDDNRTNSNASAKSFRGLRTHRSQSGSATEVCRSEGAIAIAKRGQPPQVGFE